MRGGWNINEWIKKFNWLSISYIVDPDSYIHVQYISLILKINRYVIIKNYQGPGIRQDPGIECVRPDGACLGSPTKQSLDGYPDQISRVTIKPSFSGIWSFDMQ